MKALLRKLVKFIAYTAAGIVILLAIAVGLFRLFLPRLPEYQEEIKAWASGAIGIEVQFSGMDARWGLSGPELEFYDAELLRPANGVRIVAAEEVRIGVSLVRWMTDRALVVDRVVIRDSSVDIRELEDGSFWVQGGSLDELLSMRRGNAEAPAMDFIGEQLEVSFMRPGDERPHFFAIPRVRVSIDERRIAADADIRLPDELGRALSVSATQLLTDPAEERGWDIAMDADNVSLRGWSNLARTERRFESGIGDVELGIAVAGGGVRSITADVDFVDVALANEQYFDLSGHVEVDLEDDGWLVAANELALSMPDHDWPPTSARLEASTDPDGSVVLVDLRASYLNLNDAGYIAPWLSDAQRAQLTSFDPSGEIRDLEATVSEFATGAPRFSASATLDRVGIAADGDRPGARGFSGLLRANQSGGLLEISTDIMSVSAPRIIDDLVELDSVEGTVIWRQSSGITTILSDSIRVASDYLDSESNIQLVVGDESTGPVIDLSSTWSISDVAKAKRLIPRGVMKEQLYDWFQMALVSGSIPRGTTKLNGPVNRFPFDGGEGQLLITGSVRNLNFKYHRDWPAAEQADLEVILDNARLYSEQNRSVNAGNSVVDARFDIPDLRDPVLRIESFATGTLESIRQFSLQSPISRVFGGNLDRVAVDGDATFSLDLLVPLKRERVREFEFVSRIRSTNGSLQIEGFPAPITELIGDVTISRDKVTSQSLGGQFLGQPVTIELAGSEDPRFTVLARANGTLTDEGLVDGLGVPLEGLVAGATPYEVEILFPRGGQAEPPPLTIQVSSDLQGLELDLPEPAGKDADSAMQIRGDIRFMPGGEVIESAGFTENRVAWQLSFTRPEDIWDLDRGVVTLGGDVMQPAETRGLHIRGATDVVRLGDWLELSRSGEKNVGAADRIRSIDINIDDLYLLGQHLRGHHVRVDRSARDWIVRLDGEDVVGSVLVPYDFGSDREMVLEMERLRLPGDDDGTAFVREIDPRTLPPISLTVQEFALGDRYLGSVEATIEKTEDGLDATTIRTRDPTFEIVGTGRWVADDVDPLGSHSFITATLTSSDVKETMARLNYTPGIVSDSMSILFDLDWSGSPRSDFFGVLGGDVQVRFGNGQLEEVEPGAGRMFGLMSIVALPRRLSLDFRDVFNKGFGFDEITGSFSIVDGRTYTCDLKLDGPAAAIGIVGEADIVNRNYSQTAAVSANVGNTLPIVGAVVAGPQAAAALLIFSQIFKKPLSEVGQVYYGIDGPWDDPVVESTDSAAFVASGERAGCLADTE